MCIQIYKRCICGHREKHSSPKKCEKAKKASRTWFAALAGPKLDGKGYCKKKKEDSFGVPEPCWECRDGQVTRLSGPAPVRAPENNVSGYAYSHGVQGMALPPPPPPPKAHMSPPYSSAPPRVDNQQPQGYQDQYRRPTKYENPRQSPVRPSRSTNYAPGADVKARKQSSDKYAKKTIREAEKVSKDAKKMAALGQSEFDDIRARAIDKARKESRRRPEPSSSRPVGSSSYPAALNVRKDYHHAAMPSSSQGAAYPDLRHHPAMRSDVAVAATYEGFTAGVNYDEGTRRFQDSTVRLGAASHPDRYRIDHPVRDQRKYATRVTADRYHQQPLAASYGGYSVGESSRARPADSPPESEISAFNITQKLPYTYSRR
ncbi:hypothetical protein VM1G_02007 [Cytospora mali]|uniref:Uncharacterized protein n=1 Tax=Cytospora mali TaxID=578113 RepID=A0A194VSR4_CYTMA|nr:hypothetical protein VM1G_02007 [Valsa mali]